MGMTAPARRPQRENTATLPVSLDLRAWHNWVRLSGIAGLTVAGLSLTVFLLLYPWGGTDFLLVGILVLIMAATITHLTRFQRDLLDTRSQQRDLQQDVSQEKVSRLYDLLDVSRILNTETDSQSVFDSIAKMCVEIFACEKASLMLYDEKTQYLEVMAAVGYADRKMIGARQKIGNGIAGWVGNQRESVLLQKPEDREKYPGLNYKVREVASAMVVPIVVQDKLIGVLSISNRSVKIVYDEEDLRAVVVFSQNIGACIHNAMKIRTMSHTIRDQQRELNKKYVSGDS